MATVTYFGQDIKKVVVNFGAAGTDTNTGGFELLYLKVRHIPAERESQ